MKKLLAVALVVMFLMPLAVLPAFAAADAGNKLCPISGEPVSGTSFVEYQGKRYGLCCPACEKMFLNDPEKYIAQMEAKEKSPGEAAVAPVDPASEEMERDMERGSL